VRGRKDECGVVGLKQRRQHLRPGVEGDATLSLASVVGFVLCCRSNTQTDQGGSTRKY
jgi:hypothetical protein